MNKSERTGAITAATIVALLGAGAYFYHDTAPGDEGVLYTDKDLEDAYRFAHPDSDKRKTVVYTEELGPEYIVPEKLPTTFDI